MTTAHLPPLDFDDGGLRISLFPSAGVDADAGLTSPALSSAGQLRSPKFAELDGRELATPKPLARVPSPQPPPTPQAIPVHPIPSLQDAFTESLDEVTFGSPTKKPKLAKLDARTRRERLLAQDKDAPPFDAAWRYRPNQKQHELYKLVAQISFGVYLMLNGMASSNAQVIDILQGHIDEVDEFLEVTLADMSQAIDDLSGRIEHLKLPLSNIRTFEELLENREFRCEILDGNEKIDHVLARTNVAMKQWDDDIEAGLHCTAAFISWLNDEKASAWRTQQPEVVDAFDAMKGNAEGWLNAYDEINDQAQELNNLVIRLTTIIAEMQKKAGEISRRTWTKIPPFSLPSRTSRSSFAANLTLSPTGGPEAAANSHQQPPIAQRASRSKTVTLSPTEADFENIEFPLPGGLPLLPPHSSSKHHQPSKSQSSQLSSTRSIPTPASSAIDGEATRDSPSSDEALYTLQPCAYTPTREAVSSPVRDGTKNTLLQTAPQPAQAKPRSLNHDRGNGHAPLNKHGSIRQRVSLRTSLPDAIAIPPRSTKDMPVRGPSPKAATPRTTNSQPFEPAYGPDTVDTGHRRNDPATVPDLDESPPVRPQILHSPRSDQQRYYRPVRASPHSPLQQRPHTAGGPRAPKPHVQHTRNQPSHVGGMSTLSNVTAASSEDRSIAPSTKTITGSDRTLKKKKSAFGWFKKAFSLDEEERAAFEARKAMAHNYQYRESYSPKFVDGRRIR